MCERYVHTVPQRPFKVTDPSEDTPSDITGHHSRGHHNQSPCHSQGTHDKYDSSIHWSWQINLNTGLWTPEVYEVMSWPITITRIIPCNSIEALHDSHERQKRQKRLCHFDFEVEVWVRELGHCLNPLKWSTKPPELRRKRDTGLVQPPDITPFCLFHDSPLRRNLEHLRRSNPSRSSSGTGGNDHRSRGRGAESSAGRREQLYYGDLKERRTQSPRSFSFHTPDAEWPRSETYAAEDVARKAVRKVGARPDLERS